MDINPLSSYNFRIFSPIQKFVSSFCQWFPVPCKLLIFIEIQLIYNVFQMWSYTNLCKYIYFFYFIFQSNSVGASLFSIPCPALMVCRHFDDGHSEQWGDTHFSFGLYFSSNQWCWALSISSCVFGHLYVFGETSV